MNNSFKGLITRSDIVNVKFEDDRDGVYFTFQNKNSRGETIDVYLCRYIFTDELGDHIECSVKIFDGKHKHTDWWGEYNPLYKDSMGLGRLAHDYDWYLPFTKENVNKLIDEIYRRSFVDLKIPNQEV